MARQVKGARANKPNDSFGVMNDPNVYRNKYREEIDKDDEDEVDQTELAPTEESEATPKNESFAATEKEGESDAYKKRYDDLKRHYDKKLDEWKSERDALESANKVTDTGVQMPTTPEEITEFKQKYPDVYKVVESVASMQAEQKTGDLKEKIDSLQQREEDLIVQNAYSELLTAHPDFQDIKTDEKFLEWLDEQPTSIANGIYKNNKDAKWASRVLDLYKVDAGITSKKTTSTNKQSAAEVVKSPKAREISDSNSNKKIWKMQDIAKMKSWEFEKLEKEIDLARAEGRITQ
tara:strand:+ start:634 stop:1509 length:876 start_codon:yes stop_codon:yes gene_type:complete